MHKRKADKRSVSHQQWIFQTCGSISTD